MVWMATISRSEPTPGSTTHTKIDPVGNVTTTGILSVDWALGVGGIYGGRLYEVFGDYGCGKSCFTYNVIGEYQRKNTPVQKVLFKKIPYSPGWRLGFSIFENELFESSTYIKNIFWIILAFSLFILLVLTLWTARNFSKPLESASKKINGFSINNLNIKISEEGPKEIALFGKKFNEAAEILTCTVKELNYSKDKLRNTNIELQSSNEELQASSEQLEASFQQIEDLSEKFEMIILLTLKMSEASEGNENEFLKNILQMTISLIPNADNGSVSIFQGEKWLNVCSIGQDGAWFNNLGLSRSDYPNSNGKRLIIWKDPYSDGKNTLGEKAFTALEKTLKLTKERIFSDLQVFTHASYNSTQLS